MDAHWTSTDVPEEPGVYRFLLNNTAELPFVHAAGGACVYVGSSRSLALRIKAHYCWRGTGSSTLRRSIGALLKNELYLTATPRANGNHQNDFSHYRFTDDGEMAITDWMKRNLTFEVTVEGDPRSLEGLLIADLRPVLCLRGWNNPDAVKIRELRQTCVLEAAAHHSPVDPL